MKTCLYRYIAKSLTQTEFTGHSAEWESWCIADILKGLGFTLHTLNWKGKPGFINQKYDLVFDIARLEELSGGFDESTVKFFHMTGSDSGKRNHQEAERVREVNARRGCNLKPQRLLPDPEVIHQSIELADYITLVGNQETLNTYPEQYRDKIHLVDITASGT